MSTDIEPATMLPLESDAHFGKGSITGIPVTEASDSEIAEIEIVLGARHLYFEVKNSHGSAVAFDEFTIQRRPHKNAAWEMLANEAGDYTDAGMQAPFLEVSGEPVTLAQNASTFIRMELQCTQAVRIAASGNGAASTADIHYRVQ